MKALKNQVYRINWQSGFLRLSKHTLVSYLIVSTVLVGSGIIFLFNPFTGGPKEASAAWFDDNWAFRKRVDLTISSNSADATNVDLYFTVDTTGITASLQTNCEDMRFTNTNGKLLAHFFQTSCSDNSATNKIWVRADLIPKNTTTFTIYMYYGNPTALSANGSSDLNTGLFRIYNGMTGYWPMNESSWTIDCSTRSVTDLSGSAFNLASCPNSTGPTQTTSGKFDKAGSFDGTSAEYLGCTDAQCGGTSNLDIAASEDFSVAAWVKTSSANTMVVASKEDFSDGSNPDGWGMWVTGGFVEGFFRDNESSFQVNSTADGTTVNDNAWHHIVVVFNRFGTIDRYVDGSQTGTKDSISAANGAVLDNADDFRIGERGVDGLPFTGTIDDVRFYNRALSASEITELNSKNGTVAATTAFASEEKAPSPTLYWKFDDPAVSGVIQDGTTNGLDGTLNNTPTFQTEDQCVSGKCYYFSGTANMNVSRADDAKLDFVAADNFTIQAWVKRNGASSAVNYILTKAQAGYTGYKLYQDASGDYCFDVSDGTNTDTACTSAVEFDDDQWHFITGVKAATTSITLYVDGKQRAQDASIAATGTLANTGTFYAGVDLDGTSNEWLGFIDEVKVFRDQTARTAAQVLADYNARSNPEGVSQQQGNNITNMPAVLSNGLVGYWKLDEAGDATRVDSSGNGNSLTESASDTVAQAAGKFNYAADFELGDTEYLSVADSASLSVTGSLTLSAWINPETVSAGSYNILAKWDGANVSYRLFQNADEIRLELDSANNYQETTASNLAAGTWYHVVGVYNASNATAKIYINGAEAASTTTGTIPSSIGDDGGAFQIGAQDTTTTPTGYYDGIVDEARIYNRALSGAEVAQLYNWAPGPLGYWKMDERTGTSAYDSSGNANTGTLTSSPTWTNGKYGGGLKFDGSAAHLLTGSPAAYNRTTNITLSAWVYPTVVDGTSDVITGWGGTGTEGYKLYLFNTSKFSIYTGGGRVDGTTTVVANTWYHVAGTIDQTGLIGKIYVNGVLENSGAVAATAGTGPFTAGKDPSSAAQYFGGTIDDAKIYDYERTAAQVIEDMNAGHPAPGSPVGTPVGWWKFNEGSDNMCSGGTNDVCNSGSSTTALDGTLTASSRTLSGKFGQALDGATNRRATVADSANLDFVAADDFSISFWFKSDSATNPSANEYFVEKGGIVGTAAVGYAVYTASSGGTVCFGIDDDAVTNFPEDETCSASDIYDAAWHHILAKKTGTSRLDLYVDGKPNGTADTAISATGTLDNAATFYIGDANATDGTDEFLGDLDDVKVYRSALTNSQAALDMNQASTQVLGALGTNSSFQPQAASQEYCIPGDSSTCTVPTARWDMEEGTGTAANDTSGNGRTASFANTPVWSIGKVGKSLLFNGSNNNLTTGVALSNFITASASTIEVWMKPMATGPVPSTGFIYDIPCATCDTSIFIGILHGTIGGLDRIWVYNWDGNADSVGITYTVGEWAHITLVHSGGTLYAYKNGILVGTTASGDTQTLTGTVNIARNPNTIQEYFNGYVDQVRYFNYARSAAQVAWDYNKGKPIAYWKMDECQGTTINDSAGNSLTGTLSVTTVGTCTTASSAWGGPNNDGAGKRNYTVELDGTDDYIEVSDNAKLDFGDTEDLSIEGWFYRDTFTTDDVIVAKRNGIATTDAGYIAYIDDSTDKLTFEVSDGGGGATDDYQVESISTFTATGWNHFVLVWDQDSAANSEIYINGLDNDAADTGTIGDVGSLANALTLRLGSESDGANYFDGRLDNIRVYNYALTATQVKTLYNEGAARYGPSTGAP